MKKFINAVVVVFLIPVALCPVISAQQSETPNHPPRLTMDDVHSSQFDGAFSTRLPNKWIRYPFDGIGISLELPGEPLMLASVETPQTGVASSFYSQGSGFRVLVNYAHPSDPKDSWRAVDALFEVISNHPAITDLRVTVNRNSKAKRIPLVATCKVYGMNAELRGAVLFPGRHNEVAIVLSYCLESNTAAKADGARAVASIQMRP